MAKSKDALKSLEEIVAGLDSLKTMSDEPDLPADAPAKIAQQRQMKVDEFNALLPALLADFQVLGNRLDFSKATVAAEKTELGAIGAALNFQARDKEAGKVTAQLSALAELHALAPDLAKQIMVTLPGFLSHRAALQATLSRNAAAPAAPAAAPTRPADVDAIASHALALLTEVNAEQALCVYLANPKVMEVEASHALVALKAENGPLADRVADAMPTDRKLGMYLGGAGMDQIAILSVGSPESFVEVVKKQLRNDQRPEKGMTDKNNMSAPYFVMQMIKSHELANVILGLLGKDVLKQIVNMSMVDTFDPDASREAQQKIREYWNERRKTIRTVTREYRQEMLAEAESGPGGMTAPAIVAPAIDLDKDVDLEKI